MNVGGTIPVADVLNGVERESGESHRGTNTQALILLSGCGYHMSHEGQCPFLYHGTKTNPQYNAHKAILHYNSSLRFLYANKDIFLSVT